MAVPRRRLARPSEEGFSLVEVMVIVLILGVLIAMAAAVFILSQQKSRDAAAKTLATHGLQTQKVYMAGALRYGAASEVAPLEPALTFAPLPAEGASVMGKVYIRDASDVMVELVTRSASGKCFWMRDVSGETTYASGSCTTPPDPADYGASWR